MLKVSIPLIVIGSLIVILIGKSLELKFNSLPKLVNKSTHNQSNTPLHTPEASPDLSKVKKIVSDGIASGYYGSWVPFELDIPAGWVLSRQEDDTPGVLTKGDYELTIVYPIEGAVCVFSDTPPYEGPAGEFELYLEFNTEFGVVRLGMPKSNQQIGIQEKYFTVCQKEKTSNYWLVNLSVGDIFFRTPLNPDLKIIDEMINIVKSIKVTSR